MLGQRDIVLIVKCEMFFLFAWDNNWEYMDLPIHALLLWQHFFHKVCERQCYERSIVGYKSGGVSCFCFKLACMSFVKIVSLSSMVSAWLKGSFLVQISFSKAHSTERLCKHELAMIRALHEIFNVLCQHEIFSAACPSKNFCPLYSKFIFLKCISYL